jgi:hypothetical protein
VWALREPSQKEVSKNKGIRKQFFSEEKNQKTFALDAIPNVSTMASTLPRAQEQKSFGSFLQKRTFFLLNALTSLDFFRTDAERRQTRTAAPDIGQSVSMIQFRDDRQAIARRANASAFTLGDTDSSPDETFAIVRRRSKTAQWVDRLAPRRVCLYRSHPATATCDRFIER